MEETGEALKKNSEIWEHNQNHMFWFSMFTLLLHRKHPEIFAIKEKYPETYFWIYSNAKTISQFQQKRL